MADVGALKGIKVGICGIKCSDLTKEAIKIIGVFFSCYKNLRLENNIPKSGTGYPGLLVGPETPGPGPIS